uniref:Reverse transcriptase domain-containing protein n=1 Tax=Tanacetum cinerariifolium TaxID=118510 RepID=A0A699GV65_TANCI|nr:hypothetical protein [Tanacetum cinerariifolium]
MNLCFFEPNPCYEPNSSSFDQYQPLQSSVTQQLPQKSNENIKLEMAKLIKNNRILLNDNIFPHGEESMEHAQPEDTNELFQELLEDLQILREELAEYINSPSWNHPTFYDNNEEHFIQYQEYSENSSNAITPVLPTEEPKYSLSMRYKHLNTILKMESNEVIEYSVEKLVQIPSEYQVIFDNESECDVPVKDESSLVFTTFSNPLFDNDDFTSSDDESLSNEDVPMEDFKVYSNLLFDDEEINSDEIDPHCFNAESDLIESLSNQDTLIDSSPKFDYLEEISGELMPTSIVNQERIKREHEEYISLMEKLLAINSFPHPLENVHANTIIKTLPTSPIPVEDSDSLREEIDIFTGMDDFVPPGIESDDYDSEGDIHFLEELFGELISAVMNNIDELVEDECFDPGSEIDVFTNIENDDYFPVIFVIRNFLPYLTYPEVSPLLLSIRSEDTIFDPGISI